eukprot:159630-Pyramimonas_sp.AAC.1
MAHGADSRSCVCRAPPGNKSLVAAKKTQPPPPPQSLLLKCSCQGGGDGGAVGAAGGAAPSSCFVFAWAIAASPSDLGVGVGSAGLAGAGAPRADVVRSVGGGLEYSRLGSAREAMMSLLSVQVWSVSSPFKSAFVNQVLFELLGAFEMFWGPLAAVYVSTSVGVDQCSRNFCSRHLG